MIRYFCKSYYLLAAVAKETRSNIKNQSVLLLLCTSRGSNIKCTSIFFLSVEMFNG